MSSLGRAYHPIIAGVHLPDVLDAFFFLLQNCIIHTLFFARLLSLCIKPKHVSNASLGFNHVSKS